MSKTVILASDGISLSDTKTLEETVSSHSTSISNNATAIALKANSSDVYTKNETDGLISTEVSNRNSAIEQSASQIQLSVSETYSTKVETKMTNEIEGNIIQVDDAMVAPAISLIVRGKSEQVTTTGKNLWDDARYAEAGWALVSGSNYYRGFIRQFYNSISDLGGGVGYPENTQITICLDIVRFGSSGSMQLRFEYTDGTTSNTSNLTSSHFRYSYTSTAGKTVSRTYIYTTAGSTNDNFCFRNLQVGAGVSPTAYEPYTGLGASPSPDFPQPIDGVQSLAVLAVGTNLLDASSELWEPGAFDEAGGDTSTSFRVRTIDPAPLPVGTYTLWVNAQGANVGVSLYDRKKEFIRRQIATGTSSLTFTTTDDTRYARFYFGIDDIEITPQDVGNYQPMLATGSTATTYEPYVGQTVPDLLPEGTSLRSLPDGTKDALALTYLRPSTREGWAWYSREVTRRVVAETFDGTDMSHWTVEGTTNPYWSYRWTTTGATNSDYTSLSNNNSCCTAARVATVGNGSANLAYFNTNLQMRFRYRVTTDETVTVDELAEYFAEHPTTFLVPMQKPITTQLDPIELPILHSPICTVYATADVTSGLYMKYWTLAAEGVVEPILVSDSSYEGELSAITTRVSTAESNITQNANNIATKVSKDGVISSINQSAEEIKIQASKVNIDGTAIFTNSDFQTQLNNQGYATTTQVATAKSEAISAAASDATSKANAAQSAAISTAAADATSKANAAEANAKNDTTTKLQNYTTTTDMNTAIGTAKSEAISTASNDATSKANAAEANAIAAIPTDISELNNDTGFITNADVPTKVSELTNDSGFQTASQVNTTITGKGYQTSSQVESAITSKGYATTTQAQGYATTAEQNAKTYAEGQANTVNSALETYKTTTNSTLTSLQNQVDGQIEAWYKTVDPTLSNEPASTWNTDALKARHEGDIYYNVESGHSWRWMRSGSTYSWQQIPDSDAAAALAVAQNAQSLANSKRRIFTSTPTVPYDVGDLWVDGTSIKYANASKTDSQTYSENDWAVTATDDSLAQTALNAAGVVQDNLNSARTWYAECDDAAATVAKVATITPVTEDFVLTVGSVVYIKFAITNSAAVASITLNVNNTGAKRIQYTASGGNVANLPAVGYLVADRVYQFIYDGTYWVLQYNYNSNTTYNLGQNLYYNTLKAKSAIAAETIIVGDADGYAQAQAGITFDLSYPILWCTKAIAVDKTNYANIYTSIQDRNLKTHYSSFQGTVRAMVYLVGTVSGNTITLDSSMLTSTEPTTEDGKIYIPIGRHGNQYDYTSAPAYFFFDCQTTTLFAYLDREFRQVTPTEIVSTHRIYYRTATANSSLTAPTTWIEEATGNVYNQWTTKVPPLAVSTISGQTKYLYLYTCEQRKRLDGTTVCTKVLLDENTTVIDGGSIITNSVTANQIAASTITADKLNATDINASNSFTIGALDSDTQDAILNSNISVGGRNLLPNSQDWSGATKMTNGTIVVTSNTYGGCSVLTHVWGSGNSDVGYQGNVWTQPIEADTWYTLSFWAKASSTIESTSYFFSSNVVDEGINSSGKTTTSTDGTIKNTITTEWQRIWVSWHIKADAASFPQQLIVARLQMQHSGVTLYLAGPKLEKGNKATDWTPAPEDVHAAVSEAAKTATNYITADLTGIKIHMSSNSTTYQHQSSTATTYYVNGNKRAEVSANGLEVFDGTYGSEESVAAFGTNTRLGKADGNKVIADSTGVHIYNVHNVQGLQVSQQVAEFGRAPGELTTTMLSDEPEIGTSYPVPSDAIEGISIMLDDQELTKDTDYTLSSGIVTLLESATVIDILDDSSTSDEDESEDVKAHSLTCEYTASAGVGLAIGASVTRPGLDVAERAIFRHPSFVEASHSTANADTGFRAVRNDTGIQVFCGIGIGGINHGVYSQTLKRWLIHADGSAIHVAPHTVTDGNINIKSKWVYATTPSASKGNGWGHGLQYLDTAGDLVGVAKAYSLTTGEKGIQFSATRKIGSTTVNNGIMLGVDASGNRKLNFNGGGRTLWRQALGFEAGHVNTSYGGTDNAPKNAYRDIPITFGYTHTYTPHVVATFSTGSTGVTMGGLSLSVLDITTTGCKVRIYNNTNDARNPALEWVAID